jgi:TolB-like protein
MTGVAELRLLGSFGLYRADGVRVPITSKRSVALLALLALSRSGGRRRPWLQAQLWGSRGDAQGRASLRRELSNLRTTLYGHGVGELIASDHAEVRLDLARVAVDARPGYAPEPGGQASRGEFLEGLDIPGEEQFEDWLREQRGRLSGGGMTEPDSCSNACVGLATLACGNGAEEAALAEGIADELAREVARLSGRAILRDHSASLRPRFRIGGRLRRAGSDVRAAVMLFDDVRGGQIWAERFDGRLAEGFAFETRIAGLVAPIVAALIAAADGGKGDPK